MALALRPTAFMSKGTVVLHLSRPLSFLEGHEGRTLSWVAESIARLKDFDYAAAPDSVDPSAGSLFFVPDETLVSGDAAALGVSSAKDLFGGVVPYPFVKTKTISHGLVSNTAARPDGWLTVFADRIRHDVVLPGYSAFTRADARSAARRLLPLGAVRAKQPCAAGGRGQCVLRSMRETEALLETLDDSELEHDGLVLEVNLERLTTRSVGFVTLDDEAIAYHGQQRMTSDNDGRPVYGGSELRCVRGGWEGLERLELDGDTRTAVRQSRVYDEATTEYGVIASRRNYDVGRGCDGAGRQYSGVFEASWRAGGASPAEVIAFDVFARDPAVDVAVVSTVEAYGAGAQPPPNALVHFHGVDPTAGPLVRYSYVRSTSRR
jgi:hypothetical protein